MYISLSLYLFIYISVYYFLGSARMNCYMNVKHWITLVAAAQIAIKYRWMEIEMEMWKLIEDILKTRMCSLYSYNLHNVTLYNC